MTTNKLWLRWTGANAFGEMFGLGLTFAITGWFFPGKRMRGPPRESCWRLLLPS
jgi:hypothetical protein